MTHVRHQLYRDARGVHCFTCPLRVAVPDGFPDYASVRGYGMRWDAINVAREVSCKSTQYRRGRRMKAALVLAAIGAAVIGFLYFRSGGQFSGGNFGTIWETSKGVAGQAANAGEGYAVKVYNEPWFWSVTICTLLAIGVQRGWSKLPAGIKMTFVAVAAATAAIIVYKFGS